MDIRTALEQLVALELVSITSPVSLAIVKAWKYFVPSEVLVIEPPCFMNGWRLVDDAPLQYGPKPDRLQHYTVHIQLFIDPVNDQENAADIATAFHVAFVAAYKANPLLGGTVKESALRGGDPTLCILERGGHAYLGLDLFLDLELWA